MTIAKVPGDGCATRKRVLFIGHEATRSGAPVLLLSLLRWLKANAEIEIEVCLAKGGGLEQAYRALGPTVVLNRVGWERFKVARGLMKLPIVGDALRRLDRRRHSVSAPAGRFDLVYVNSVASANAFLRVAPVDAPVILHVHEMRKAMVMCTQPEELAALLSRVAACIAVSEPVRANLEENYGMGAERLVLLPAFIEMPDELLERRAEVGAECRRALKIPEDALVVGAAGAAGRRKGTDLFVEMAQRVMQRMRERRKVHFLWVGKKGSDEACRQARETIHAAGMDGVVHFTGEQTKPLDYFCVFDVYALCSREDPFPLVALEAAMLGLPVVSFAGVGGIPGFLGEECGSTVPFEDVDAMSAVVEKMLLEKARREEVGARGARKVRAECAVGVVAPRIWREMEKWMGCGARV